MGKLEDRISEYPIDKGNLVELVSDETLVDLGDMVVDSYEVDVDSYTDWNERRKNWLRLFMQKAEATDFPFTGSANVPMPILTTATIQFQARAYEALLPPKDKVKVTKTGGEDRLRSERVAKHMNYQLDHQMEEFEEGWDVSLFQLPINGSIFRKTFYDPVKQRNVSEYAGAEDVVVNYHCSPYKTPDRITHEINMNLNDVKIRESLGVFQNVDDLYEQGGELQDSKISRPTKIIRQESNTIDGIQQPADNKYSEGRFLLEQQCWYDLNEDGIKEPYIVTVDYETRNVLRITKRSDNEGRYIEYWTHYYFFPNPEGYYGLGFGHILEGINEAASSLLKQIIDAGTMANLSGKTGFINSRSGIKKGDIQLSLGDYKKIDVNSDDVRKAIYSFDFPGPNNVLFSVLGLLQEYATRVTTVSETLTGELPSSDTPATAIVSAIEQGIKVFSVIHKRIHRTFKKELKKIYTLNEIYTPQEEYLDILGDDLVAAMNEAQLPVNVRADYKGGFDIIPVSDPNITSRTERVALAEQVFTITTQSPATANNMNAITEAQRRLYEALGVDEVNALLQPPPPPPDLPQVQENGMMLRDEDINALPAQLHVEHLVQMQDFELSPVFEDLSPRGKNIFEKHRQQHTSYQYQLESGVPAEEIA